MTDRACPLGFLMFAAFASVLTSVYALVTTLPTPP
jgi:hypothetical protein